MGDNGSQPPPGYSPIDSTIEPNLIHLTNDQQSGPSSSNFQSGRLDSSEGVSNRRRSKDGFYHDEEDLIGLNDNDHREDLDVTPEVDRMQTPPPEFSLYRAKFTTDSIGNITSHDEHLNSDGEALCRFVLLHLSTPPELFVRLTGNHEETTTEMITETVNDRVNYRYQTRKQTVTDFSFSISLSHFDGNGTDCSSSTMNQPRGLVKRLYVVGDSEFVGRGGHWLEAQDWKTGKDLKFFSKGPNNNSKGISLVENESDNDDRRRLVNHRSKNNSFKNVRRRFRARKVLNQVNSRGYPPFVPPWIFPEGKFTVTPDRPPDELLGPDWNQRTQNLYDSIVDQGHYIHIPMSREETREIETELRSWCDEYCKSRSSLKEFRVKKLVFGWDLEALERELLNFLSTIPNLRSTNFSVNFQTTSSSITIRPINKISKVFSLSGFYKFLLTIALIYPILWLVRYLILGVEYNVIRAAYPLIYWDSYPQVEQASSSTRSANGGDGQPSGSDVSGGQHFRVLRGMTERVWFDQNRARITVACQSGKIGSL
ncbi:hypothetical protein BY996DRAFT_6824439 [Phakopsora pachyrhizi]|uniref:Uncharacterized protein n=1 Tax=Phakopsora pachyrhizi TaxID=170000 RepID=A0AAV0BI67_PHAPC|nr:hypothetical protein BY996DRAFT_6824439 [Phakopsora pachyrhizi]CAH7686136.1 hypothetical protein PPACK8108_LOCUS20748 [Phakopsora pachyrhizi]